MTGVGGAAICLWASVSPIAATAEVPPPLAAVHYQTEDKLVFLTVRVDGSGPLTFVLDSGAPHTVVDSTVARKLGLSEVSIDSTRGVGRGTVSRRHLGPVEVTVGKVSLRIDDPWMIDLGQVAGIRHVDGLLGADLFERFVVRIDPVGETLTIFDPETFRRDSSGTSVPLIVESGRLYVDMELTVTPKLSEVHRMRIDTGSGDAASDNLVRQSPVRRKSVQGVGLGQSYVDYSGVFASIRIGPYRIRNSWGPANDHPAVG